MPMMLQTARWFGSYEITFVIVLVSGCVAYALLHVKARRLCALVGACVFAFQVAAGGVLLFHALRTKAALTALYARYGAKNAAEFLSRAEAIDRGREQVHAYRDAAKDAYDTETKLQAVYNRALIELDTVAGRFGTRLPETDVPAFLSALSEKARAAMEKKKLHEARIHAAQDVADALCAQLVGTSEREARALMPTDREIRPEDVRPEELSGFDVIKSTHYGKKTFVNILLYKGDE
jgi:hypothetical protein